MLINKSSAKIINVPIIYCIKNTISNRIYIGSALKGHARFSEHKNLLLDNSHSNLFLQNDYNKHNGNNFVFIVLEILIDKTNLLLREQVWLDLFHDKQVNCYNILSVAGSHLGAKRSQETKDKMSLASKGKPKSIKHTAIIKENAMKKVKPILQFDLLGNFIKEHIGICEAARELEVSKQCIIPNLSKKRLTGGKFLWEYKSYYNNIEETGLKLKQEYDTRNKESKEKQLKNLELGKKKQHSV